MLRPLEDPAIPSEAVDDTPAPGWLCARRSRAGSFLRTAAPRRWVYCVGRELI